MDERLRICLWMVGVGGFGAVLGGVFGAVTAVLYARNGGAAGTRLARNLVKNFFQSGDGQPSPTFHAAVLGAADGFFFLGTLGLVAGAFLGKCGWTANELLLPIVLSGVLLIGGAMLFGTLAYALTYRTAECLYCIAGSILGSILAARLLGSVYGPVGIMPGMGVGLFLCRAVRAYSPKFHPPRAEKTTPRLRSDANTDITGSLSSPPNADFFRKPDSIEEG
ncbi:MAG TPA: hypothetical protein VMG10_36705 [Gemmataceae bacterium]|nr:hypothetical protein [Gemmataceae bacterium]